MIEQRHYLGTESLVRREIARSLALMRSADNLAGAKTIGTIGHLARLIRANAKLADALLIVRHAPEIALPADWERGEGVSKTSVRMHAPPRAVQFFTEAYPAFVR
jgi:hypothetical protein